MAYIHTESSRRYYTEAPKIIQSRGSSSDSRSSYDSRGSTEAGYYASSKSSAMGSYGGSQSRAEVPKERKYRAPDAEGKYVSSKSRGQVDVIDHRQRILDPQAPRSGDATSTHYKDTQRVSSKHSSTHKHSSHRR